MSELELRISRAILKNSTRELVENTNTDVLVVGAGPAGMVAARYLAKEGFRVVILERRLSFGGGIGGGGMLFHKIAVSEEALPILRELGMRYHLDSEENLYMVDAPELMAKLATGAIDAGAKMFLGVQVEDVIYRDNPFRITGAVIQWSAVAIAGLHVDPLFVMSKALVDATGHPAEVLQIVSRKIPAAKLSVPGESSAYAEVSEKVVVEKTGRVLPGLYVAGMAVAALYGLPRMGPVFSSMLLSGKRVAEIISKDLKEGS